MTAGLLSVFFQGDKKMTLLNFLNSATYDELIRFNLADGQYKFLYNIEEKYRVPKIEGPLCDFYEFAAENLVHPEEKEQYRAYMDPATLAQRLAEAEMPGVLSLEYRVLDTEGNWRWVSQINVGGAGHTEPNLCYCYIFDIQNIKNREAGITRVEQRPHIQLDPLTGLMPEKTFFLSADHMLANRQINWMMIVVDIEQFKLFNDWYGRETGDAVLARIGQGLKKDAESNDGVAGYFGSDDFCLLTPAGRINENELYENLYRAIRRYGVSVGFLPALGISYSNGSASALNLFDQAALACQHAKKNFKKRVQYFEPSMYKRTSEDYRILSEFQNAIQNHEITFYLQPQCQVSTGRIVGAESLTRWVKPDGSIVPPVVFVPVLEKYGFIPDLDTYIWEEVCRWGKKRKERGLPLISVSVNVSPVDIFTLNVPEHFRRLIEKYGISKASVKIEITESAYGENAELIRETVKALRQDGFMVLMDDFGSGYSSLNMLRELNVDIIKLDAQFLRIRQEDMRKGINILESVVNMAKNLATPIIVEGVESEGQLQFLKELGCAYVQGYLFYRPLPVAEFEQLIADPAKVDPDGVLFKPNQQLKVREFLDENIFTDTMLNNALGPVVFYSWNGQDIDIVRFNEQFFEVVGINVGEFSKRRMHIQDFLHPADKEQMLRMFREAEEHWAVGSKGVIRVYRPNGALVWLELRMFFINEDAQGKKFYAAARDVTETQVINTEMPGAYYRCAMDEEFEFLYLSQNYLRMTGYTEHEIRREFGNKLIRMVHPNDVERLLEEAAKVAKGELVNFRPYRIRHKRGDYIYVAENSHITDRFGAPCWQTIAIDVSELMHMRNQMRLLSKFMKVAILFLRQRPEGLRYEVAVNGIADVLGMDGETLQYSLNEGSLCRLIEGHRDIPHEEYTRLFIAEISKREKRITLHRPDGRIVHLAARADRVLDAHSSAEYIVELRPADG